ncbi:maleylpyruvate isomerase family mycothiol-dependent enzyme [Nocardioides acrostichi]|uniref:Maleylpyruvate isomerase family mycothiol-dependent enzyme n=1 Tax=Nocardioides acrostichi TaxID=2784339 RepID=A0A930UXR0_9ACTN|nr:maleylpyruvate isomerase family mycothiol-dependent enzyme [Nocardioides acrostichi]MBF4162056.1 maleylpyruvate isomerase family mycothiol-dependent enzyme [Nocardioides acrostichi]
MSRTDVVNRVHEASIPLLRTVDALADDDWTAPSLLPGWSRAHVIAHLALNAEGLAGSLAAATAGASAPMYASQEDRDGDIALLALATPSEIRERLMTAVTRFTETAAEVPDEAWASTVARVPGGATFAASAAPAMRWREVEVHHADLDAGYTHHDWPEHFADALVDALADRVAHRAGSTPLGFRVSLTDTGRTRDVGEHLPDTAPVVSGPVRDIGWWLSGRPSPRTPLRISVDRGGLPQIGAW